MPKKQTIGTTLRQWREAAGYRLDDAAVLASQYGDRFSRETVRRYENDMVPEHRMEPTIVAALCELYDRPLSDLSPALAERASRLQDLLARSRCIIASAGHSNGRVLVA